MSHMVIFQTPDGNPGYNQFEDLDEAVRFVESLRNEQAVSNARMFALEEIKFEFKPYYKVEVPMLESAPAAESAPAPEPAEAAAPPPPPPAPEAPVYAETAAEHAPFAAEAPAYAAPEADAAPEVTPPPPPPVFSEEETPAEATPFSESGAFTEESAPPFGGDDSPVGDAPQPSFVPPTNGDGNAPQTRRGLFGR